MQPRDESASLKEAPELPSQIPQMRMEKSCLRTFLIELDNTFSASVRKARLPTHTPCRDLGAFSSVSFPALCAALFLTVRLAFSPSTFSLLLTPPSCFNCFCCSALRRFLCSACENTSTSSSVSFPSISAPAAVARSSSKGFFRFLLFKRSEASSIDISAGRCKCKWYRYHKSYLSKIETQISATKLN